MCIRDLSSDVCSSDLGGQHLQAFFQARATEAGARGAVGLVEAGLEDEVDAEPGSDFLELAGNVELQLHRLDHAGAGDQEDGLVAADVESAEFHGSCSEALPFKGGGAVCLRGTAARTARTTGALRGRREERGVGTKCVRTWTLRWSPY